MYRRILLAYDGSREGRTALREGAVLAKRCGSAVFLLCVAGGNAGVLIAESAFAGPVGEEQNQLRLVFEEGVARLRQLGLSPTARLVAGDPATEICQFAREIDADLVVVGHRKKSLLERWWSGSSGAYLTDQLSCSLLISRNTLSDAVFQAEIADVSQHGPASTADAT
jgi:nucleotide-binding universal stress UspA family protein